jgi:hypothetical protein
MYDQKLYKGCVIFFKFQPTSCFVMQQKINMCYQLGDYTLKWLNFLNHITPIFAQCPFFNIYNK